MLPFVLDLLGVAVFAVSGALAAGRRRLDLLGVVVLGAVTAVGGGTIRDLLLDRHPIFWLADARYLIVIIATSLATVLYSRWARVPAAALDVADALGLALFSVAGTQVAERAGMPAMSSVLLGAVTGAAGGAIRDVLTAQVPMVLQRGSLYATAAIAGTSLYVILTRLGLAEPVTAVVGMLVVVAVRLAAISWGLQLPIFEVQTGEKPVSEKSSEKSSYLVRDDGES
ncbi:MAG TPA: trimeric intracellular cation channel family protein [Gemmatimonadaceae bacterium]|nr:trimeric intracellular cation channel family protein [Gemmatimonadaceae bacterium]